MTHHQQGFVIPCTHHSFKTIHKKKKPHTPRLVSVLVFVDFVQGRLHNEAMSWRDGGWFLEALKREKALIRGQQLEH